MRMKCWPPSVGLLLAISLINLVEKTINTNHWEIIIEIEKMVYILISFGCDGI